MGVVGNMGLNRQIILISGVGLLMFGCSNTPHLTKKDSVEDRAKHQSVNNFYNAGMLRCSINDLAFDDVCDYAIYKEKKSPIKVVIENVAIKTAIKYRILYFNGGKFKSKNKRDVIHFHKTESNHYQISIGKENYLLPIRVLQYQPEAEETKESKPDTNPLKEYKAPPKNSSTEEKVKVVESPKIEPKPKLEPKPEPKVEVKREYKGTKRKFKR